MKIVSFKIVIILVFELSLFLNSYGQTPVIRTTVPPPGIQIKGPVIKPANNDTVDTLNNESIIKQRLVKDSYSKYFSLLQFSDALYDPDCRTCLTWSYTKYYLHEINNTGSSYNWKKNLMWRKIPPGTVYGKWEISLIPFPVANSSAIGEIVKSGLIETQSADSVFFEINYIDDKNIIDRNINQNKGYTLPKKNYQNINSGSLNKKQFINPSQMNMSIEGLERKFYIRVIPLDINKQPLTQVSNEVIVQEKLFKPIQPAKIQAYLSNDYTITAVKYVPVSFGDPAFASCTVITSYNIPVSVDNNKTAFASSLNDFQIMGLNQSSYQEYFEQLFPVGSVLCPQAPKEKAWYEKAFNGVTGLIIKTYDGAATFYNETKNYVKNKFVEINCNADLVTNVINPVTKLQEAAGPEVCEAISGAAFDYGMVAVGIPPSLPTSDEFTALAEGQIVELACDQLEAQTGLPVPEETREAIRKEFHDKIVAQSNKGIVNCGFFNVKPDPRGLFKTAYLEIEVTRTNNNFKGKGIVGFNVNDVTSSVFQSYNPSSKTTVPIELKGNLFEKTTAYVPFLDNIGDKTTIYVVLKPQESYLWKDKQTGMINSVHSGPQPGEWSTPPTPTYEGYAHSQGFQMLIQKDANTFFSLGLKTLPGIQLTYKNP